MERLQVRLFVLGVVVLIGYGFSTKGVLGQSGEAGNEPDPSVYPQGKQFNEETKKEIKNLGPQPSGNENSGEWTESAKEIKKVGDSRLEEVREGNSNQSEELWEAGQSIAAIQREFDEEMTVKH